MSDYGKPLNFTVAGEDGIFHLYVSNIPRPTLEGAVCLTGPGFKNQQAAEAFRQDIIDLYQKWGTIGEREQHGRFLQ